MLTGIRTFLLCGLVMGPLSTFAMAADAPSAADMKRAEELYQNGAILYEEGNYQGAILAFQSSFDLSNAPALYYNIANCHERLGHLTEARDALNMYRAVAPSDERERLDRRIVNLNERIAEESQLRPSTPIASATPPANPPTQTMQADGKSNALKWTLIGVGAGLGVGGGALAFVEYQSAQDAFAAQDRTTYDSARVLNGVGFGVAGLGLVSVVVGIALPNHHNDAVSFSTIPLQGGAEMLATVTWPSRNTP